MGGGGGGAKSELFATVLFYQPLDLALTFAETYGPCHAKNCLWADADSEGPDFVCVEVLRPSQPNGVMSSAVSLPSHTFTGQA